MYKALTIAGSDSCGGAGIQADIKTMTALNVYAMSCITALTAQNTTGVKQIEEASTEIIKNQLDCIFTDIYPDAVKIGMLSNSEIMNTVAERLRYYEAKNIVIDPVMVSTSGHKLMSDEAINTLKTKILTLEGVTTPNIPEAEVLSGITIDTMEDMEKAARMIHEAYGCYVLVKGGHGKNDADDYLYGNGVSRWYRFERVNNPNTHGTGCTLSSAIASYLAKGEKLEDAVEKAKIYLSGAIADGLNLGKGSGPLNHMYAM